MELKELTKMLNWMEKKYEKIRISHRVNLPNEADKISPKEIMGRAESPSEDHLLQV